MLEDFTCKDKDEWKERIVAVVDKIRATILSHVAIIVLKMNGVSCIHAIHRATTFSTSTTLSPLYIIRQKKKFKYPLERYFQYTSYHASGKGLCHEKIHIIFQTSTELVMVPAEDHDTQGEIERANSILQGFFKGLRAEKPRLSTKMYSGFPHSKRTFALRERLLLHVKCSLKICPVLIPGAEKRYILQRIIEIYHRCKKNRKLRKAAKAKIRNPNEINKGDCDLFL